MKDQWRRRVKHGASTRERIQAAFGLVLLGLARQLPGRALSWRRLVPLRSSRAAERPSHLSSLAWALYPPRFPPCRQLDAAGMIAQ